MLSRFNRLPFELRVALIANVAVLIPNLLWFSSQFGAKIDPGLATLLGATIGLGIVGWQTNRGFRNLIRSQANQAELDRAARVHKAELDDAAKAGATSLDRAQLLASLRAEIAALYSAVLQQVESIDAFGLMHAAFAKSNVPSSVKEYSFTALKAPIFTASIPKLGLLNTDIGADIIKVLSKADGEKILMKTDTPMPYPILFALHLARADFLDKWASDLFHVAMRMRAIEEGTPDPGSLITTQAERYAKIKERNFDL